MKLRILLLLTQCICFKTNYGEEKIGSSFEEKIGSSFEEKIGSSSWEKIGSSFGEKVKADFFREAEFSDPRNLKTNSPRKIHIGASMRIIKVLVDGSPIVTQFNQEFISGQQ